MQRDLNFEQQYSWSHDFGRSNSMDSCYTAISSKEEQTCLGLQGVVGARHALRKLCDPTSDTIDESQTTKSSMNRMDLFQLLSKLGGSPKSSSQSSIDHEQANSQRASPSYAMDDQCSCRETMEDTDGLQMEMNVDDLTPLKFTSDSVWGKEDVQVLESALRDILRNDDTRQETLVQIDCCIHTADHHHHHHLPTIVSATAGVWARGESTTTMQYEDTIPLDYRISHESTIIIEENDHHDMVQAMQMTIEDDDNNDNGNHHFDINNDDDNPDDSTLTTSSSGSDNGRNDSTLDHGTRLRQFMIESSNTHEALQQWDRSRGLPASHSRTMVNSARSRKQLLDGVLLRKWNGTPLVPTQEVEEASVVDVPTRRRTSATTVSEAPSTSSSNRDKWMDKQRECYEWFYGRDS